MSGPKSQRASFPSRYSYGGHNKVKTSRAAAGKKKHSSKPHSSTTRPKLEQEESFYNPRAKYYLDNVNHDEIGFQPLSVSHADSDDEYEDVPEAEPEAEPESEPSTHTDTHEKKVGTVSDRKHASLRPSVSTRRNSSYISPRGATRPSHSRRPSALTRRNPSYVASRGATRPAHSRAKSNTKGHGHSKTSASRSSKSPKNLKRDVEQEVEMREAKIEYRPGMNEHNPWMGAARCALEAGAMAALKTRHSPGNWIGAKGTKVVSAAIGAAVVDTLLERKMPEKKGGVRHAAMIHFTEAAIGNLVIRPLVKNGSGRVRR